MTTKVQIDSLPPNRRKVHVLTLEPGTDKAVDPEIVVAPGGTATFYVHQGQYITISERED